MSSFGRVDAAPIARVVKKFCEQYETHGAMADDRKDRLPALAPSTILAERIGMSKDWVHRLMNGYYKTLKFDDADRLLCAMDLVHLWWDDLSDLYYGTDLMDVPEGQRVCGRGHVSPISSDRTCRECARENRQAKRDELDRVRMAA